MHRGHFVSVSVIVTCLVAGDVSAQHLHRHGDHFDIHPNVPHGHDSAGHLIDRFGHHIDGHGRHTGSIGVFEDGSHGGPWQGHRYPSFGYGPSYGSFSFGLSYSGHPALRSQWYGSSLYDPSLYGSSYYGGRSYGSQLYNPYSIIPYGSSYSYGAYSQRIPTLLGNSLLIAPSTQSNSPAYAAPSTSDIVVNRLPVPDAGQRGAEIRLENPRDSGGSVNYSLNEFRYTIKPGETQTIQSDRPWTLLFDNGLGKTVSVTLIAGAHYQFRVSQEAGWQVVPSGSQQPSIGSIP